MNKFHEPTAYSKYELKVLKALQLNCAIFDIKEFDGQHNNAVTHMFIYRKRINNNERFVLNNVTHLLLTMRTYFDQRLMCLPKHGSENKYLD